MERGKLNGSWGSGCLGLRAAGSGNTERKVESRGRLSQARPEY